MQIDSGFTGRIIETAPRAHPEKFEITRLPELLKQRAHMEWVVFKWPRLTNISSATQ